jgi:hypothetical protein
MPKTAAPGAGSRAAGQVPIHSPLVQRQYETLSVAMLGGQVVTIVGRCHIGRNAVTRRSFQPHPPFPSLMIFRMTLPLVAPDPAQTA